MNRFSVTMRAWALGVLWAMMLTGAAWAAETKPQAIPPQARAIDEESYAAKALSDSGPDVLREIIARLVTKHNALVERHNELRTELLHTRRELKSIEPFVEASRRKTDELRASREQINTLERQLDEAKKLLATRGEVSSEQSLAIIEGLEETPNEHAAKRSPLMAISSGQKLPDFGNTWEMLEQIAPESLPRYDRPPSKLAISILAQHMEETFVGGNVSYEGELRDPAALVDRYGKVKAAILVSEQTRVVKDRLWTVRVTCSFRPQHTQAISELDPVEPYPANLHGRLTRLQLSTAEQTPPAEEGEARPDFPHLVVDLKLTFCDFTDPPDWIKAP